MAELALIPRRAQELSERALLEFQSPSAALIDAPVQGPARRTVWIVTALFISVLVVGGSVPVDKVVTAKGSTLSLVPTLVVQPLETSIVRAINVREGQVVHAGEVLARLDPTFSESDMTALQAQVTRDQAEVDRLNAELDGTPYKPKSDNASVMLQAMLYAQRQAEFQARIQGYDQKISSLQAAATRSQSDIQFYTDRLQVAVNVESMRKQLQGLGDGSKLNTLAAMDSRLEISRSLANAISTLNGAQHDLQATVADRDAFVQQWRAEAGKDLHDSSADLSDAKENLNKAQLRHQLVDLRAQQDAVVLTVARVSVGSVMQSGDQFITLVPVDAPLEVESFVAASDAGFVHVGQNVTVKFETFPFTHYGYAVGTVRLVSPDSFTLNAGPSSTRGAGVPTSASSSSDAVAQGGDGQTYYRVRITLEQMKLHDTPPGFRLQPGMPVTADIKVGKRTMLSYMFSRVLPTFYDGMREP
jgi:HlyD family secretion protein